MRSKVRKEFVVFVYLFCVYRFAMQRAGCSNKVICLIGFVFGLLGTVLIIDWQSLGGDPCNHYNDPNVYHNTTYESIFNSTITSETLHYYRCTVCDDDTDRIIYFSFQIV